MRYSDLYASLWDTIRFDVKNFTELGVMMGQSLQTWHYYFPNAEIRGIDLKLLPKVKKNLDLLKPRNN